ncbi:dihydrolipoyl dehydrogenase [Cupriavidus oxalaticus]|jgi:dihydrolipoamide dehydrogenase|uniref:Dihydrolipoyl dehydrogenase n=1 Tax=Cupriavidus oxalaticus TaxID=96344 RepID=A0A375G8N2_9BURK|nr:dihydrolipoyl dehydrogenase [Cupriavidus oxalaticus]QRQ87704.1 dihydrolipoyl dehydrogenase [Cupriavidus oxalaticus]QRQ93969.1 dihydrolipoyl dehydrogenase [Cupriavidus oxalaticus]WQD82603.1 dihydrolipoyl dehydrogenase [Cupriavidus oxalaticus]SPC15097.1 Dihydrolipoyl dehydrogenase [Cupriavidus oxalaticus]
MTSSFDLAIVGGGPGGYVAAIRAAQLGMRTAVIEKAALGGICLNWGCIPTKALLRSADVLRLVKDAAAYGVAVAEPRADVPAMVARSRAVAAQLNKGVAHLMKKHGVTVLNGHGRLAGQGRLQVSTADGQASIIGAGHIVLATGARARPLPQLPVDGSTVWSYREALAPPSIPRRMLIVGAGAIGVEFASFYHAVGVQVTLVEMAERILPTEDAEIAAQVASQLRRDGIAIHAGTRVEGARRGASGWTVTLAGGASAQLETDVVLVAAGIVGNVEELGLEGTGVRVERTHIVTDGFGRTGEPGIYAIGDVAGPPWLAHKASHEGVICVENIAGLQPHPLDPRRIPACTYSHPQVASIGLTEAQAIAAGHRVRVGRFPFSANGKAIAMGATAGLAKVVFDEGSGELLGAHMVGDEVTEMIQGYGIAQALETTEAELMSAVLPHPTLSEAMHEAVLDAYGRALHI